MKTKRLVIDAMLVAVYFVLSNYLSVNLAGIRVALDVLPVLVSAALFGPVDAFIVGFIGNLLFQLAGPYGISATTFLWALPDGLRGLMLGFLLRGRWQNLSRPRMIVYLIITSLVFTTFTTGVMYIDCLVYQYSFAAYAPFILVRYAVGAVLAVFCAFVLPPLLTPLSRITHSKRSTP